MVEEYQEWKQKDKGKKELFKRTWIEQEEVKKVEKEINDELLRMPEQRQVRKNNEEGGETPAFSTLIV